MFLITVFRNALQITKLGYANGSLGSQNQVHSLLSMLDSYGRRAHGSSNIVRLPSTICYLGIMLSKHFKYILCHVVTNNPLEKTKIKQNFMCFWLTLKVAMINIEEAQTN